MADRVLPMTLETLNEWAEREGVSRGMVLDRLVADERERVEEKGA